jgi:hypothetical protein
LCSLEQKKDYDEYVKLIGDINFDDYIFYKLDALTFNTHLINKQDLNNSIIFIKK